MRINKNILTSFLAMLFLISACTDLDINDDPNNVGLEDLSLASLLPTTIEAASSTTYSMSSTAAKVTHQTDNVSGEYYNEFSMAGPWSTIYLKGLSNLKTLKELASTNDSPIYRGLAGVLQAYFVGLLADTWEDAPYSKAFDLTNITPAYDSQEDLYGTIQSLLNDAIRDLPDSTSLFMPGSDDLIYGGDGDKWTKAAHALKARYMIHLSNKSNVDWNAILAEVDLGFASNDDDFQLVYNATNKNPLHTAIVLSNRTGNVSVSHAEYFMNFLNGTIYPVVDPRLPHIANNDGAAEYIGVNSIDPQTQIDYNVNFEDNTFYSTESAPIIMMSYAELKFIEAEAAMNAGNPSRAYTAYRAGIKANMDKLGVIDEERMVYMSDASVDIGEANLDIEHIMREKYIAGFFNVETWTDMRRHNFSADIFKDFVEPVDPHFMNDDPAQRSVYPNSEESRNPSNAAASRRDIEAKMWRDQQ